MKKLAIMLLTGAMSLGLASCANSTRFYSQNRKNVI